MAQMTFFFKSLRTTDVEPVRQALAQAGIDTRNVLAVSDEHDGVIVTESYLAEIWNAYTGHDDSNRSDRHRPYDQLTVPQREAFAETVARFMTGSIEAAYHPADFLDDDENFPDIALEPSPPPDDAG